MGGHSLSNGSASSGRLRGHIERTSDNEGAESTKSVIIGVRFVLLTYDRHGRFIFMRAS